MRTHNGARTSVQGMSGQNARNPLIAHDVRVDRAFSHKLLGIFSRVQIRMWSRFYPPVLYILGQPGQNIKKIRKV